MNKPLVLIPFRFSSNVYFCLFVWSLCNTEQPNSKYWDNNFKIKELKLNELQIIKYIKISRSTPFTSQATSVCSQSSGLLVCSWEPCPASALLFLLWVGPVGATLIRLQPSCNSEFSLSDNLASGIPFQPVTFCQFDCHMAKKKNCFWKESILKFCILVIHCPCSSVFLQCLSTSFPRKQWGSP